MKKQSLVFIFIIAVMAFANAQEKGQNRISLVLEPVISWMKSDCQCATNQGISSGYNFGVKVDHFFDDNYAFATGLTINTAGGKIAYSSIHDQQIQTYKLKYLEIPLGLRLRSDDLRRINIYGRFGLSPQINIKVSDKDNYNIDYEVRIFDLSYHLGGGIEYSLGRRNALMIGLIFNNGFVDITKRQNFEDKTILNRFTFEFGFIF
jgi:hypothetical protein